MEFIPDFATKHCKLASLVGNLPFEAGFRVIKDSPTTGCRIAYDMVHQKAVQSKLQEHLQRMDASAATYHAVFDHLHPVGSVHALFDTRYRERWIKKGLLSSCKVACRSSASVDHLRWLSSHVPPRVHMSNIRLHLNAWHTRSRYQQTGSACVFCGNSLAEDRIEHIIFCPTIQGIMPACLKAPYTGKVSPDTWFLHGTYKQDKLLTALYVHAIYVAHNTYRHSPDRGELRPVEAKPAHVYQRRTTAIIYTHFIKLSNCTVTFVYVIHGGIHAGDMQF